MALFTKPKILLWPKNDYLEVYLDRKDNNVFTFDISLWSPLSESELQPLIFFLKNNPSQSVSILLPDEYAQTKSFIYDSKISNIEKKEVVGLAESTISFKIDPDYLEYNLIPKDDKTIIKATIFNKEKLENLRANLLLLKIPSYQLQSLSHSIAKVAATFFSGQYFFIYPVNTNEYTLFLAKDDTVYLSTNIKGPTLDIQKIINYSSLYFSDPTTKLFIPNIERLEANYNSTMEKTHYQDSQIATELKKPSNFTLPVLGIFLGTNTKNPVIIKKSMENKKNILPIIAVFIFTAVLAAIIIWVIVNKNKTAPDFLSTPSVSPTSIMAEPTAEPTKAIVELDKKLKIQVLNATDINGQAATLKSWLTKLEFESIAVGNAKENATENNIQYKKSIEGLEDYFADKLGQFPATFSGDLKETSTYDIVFTIGTDLGKGEDETQKVTTDTVSTNSAKTSTPTPKATPTIEP